MPIYMDAHILPGVTAKDVAEAHQSDLIYQAEFGCKCLTYWFDNSKDSVFCLIDAPEKEAVIKLHSKSHGLIPNKIIEVSSSLVESFLGRIQDPDGVVVSDDGLKVFSDPSFRILLIMELNDPILLCHQLGKEEANELISHHKSIGRKFVLAFEGFEVEKNEGNGIIASFKSANKALSCALAIQREIQSCHKDLIGLRISITGGDPVDNNNKLFGDSILLARNLCSITDFYRVAISSTVKELVPYEIYQNNHHHILSISPQEESFLKIMFSMLEKYWQETESGIKDYCRLVAMSQSQFYRKVVSLTGAPFNSLLQEYRLNMAKEQMKRQRFSISQITFSSGFSSPSYFTKCFKKKFGLLPKKYFDLLHS